MIVYVCQDDTDKMRSGYPCPVINKLLLISYVLGIRMEQKKDQFYSYLEKEEEEKEEEEEEEEQEEEEEDKYRHMGTINKARKKYIEKKKTP